MDSPFLGLPGRDWQWIFDVGHYRGRQSSHLSLVGSAAADDAALHKEAVAASAVATVRDAYPAARAAVVRHAVVVNERRATFSVAPDAAARPGHVTPWSNAFLAGDWIGNTLPATIEAAATSGHAAARLAARYLDL
jgi:zeta-carotene desaturase